MARNGLKVPMAGSCPADVCRVRPMTCGRRGSGAGGSSTSIPAATQRFSRIDAMSTPIEREDACRVWRPRLDQRAWAPQPEPHRGHCPSIEGYKAMADLSELRVDKRSPVASRLDQSLRTISRARMGSRATTPTRSCRTRTTIPRMTSRPRSAFKPAQPRDRVHPRPHDGLGWVPMRTETLSH